MLRSQRGYTLIELMLVMGLMSSMTLMAFLEKSSDLEVQQARVTGEKLLQYNNAARSWLSNNVGAANSNYDGSAWLKHTSCQDGLSDVGYLPCDFPIANSATPIRFGNLAIKSSVTTSGTYPNQVTKITTSTSPFKIPSGQLRSDLSGVATIVAAAGGLKNNTPVVMATEGSYGSDPTTGIITMIASNNTSNDAWLRTDGSNTMKSSITFDEKKPANLRELRNLSRVQSIVSNILYIGSPGGALTSERVVVDANTQILGSLKVSNSISGGDGITIERGDVSLLDGSITASKSISAGTDLIAESAVHGQIFYDSNNKAYYVDPDQESKLNALSTSGRIKAGEFVELSGIAISGTACTPNGLLGRDSEGAVLSCKLGLWAGVTSGPGTLSFAGSYKGSITRLNSEKTPMFVTAYGGYGNGGTCRNRYDMTASVLYGSWITVSSSLHTYDVGNKATSTSFMVPGGSYYMITSKPYACGDGDINITEFKQ